MDLHIHINRVEALHIVSEILNNRKSLQKILRQDNRRSDIKINSTLAAVRQYRRERKEVVMRSRTYRGSGRLRVHMSDIITDGHSDEHWNTQLMRRIQNAMISIRKMIFRNISAE